MSWVATRRTAASGRVFTAAVLLMVVLVGIIVSSTAPGGAIGFVQSVVVFLRHDGVVGPTLFGAVLLLAALSAAPASLLAALAGAVYGLFPGFILTALANLLGAVIAFALSRSLFRAAIARWVARHARVHSLDAAIGRDGWRLVALLRLSPVMPFSATSYLLGLSRIGLADYLKGTLLSLLPMFGYVYLGTLTDAGFVDWASGASPLRWIMLAVGGAATLLLMARLAQLMLQRRLVAG